MSSSEHNTVRDAFLVTRKLGIHARVAVCLMELVRRSDCEVVFEANGRTSRADSIIDLLTLAVCEGATIHVQAIGPAAADIVEQFRTLLTKSDQGVVGRDSFGECNLEPQ